MKIKKEQKAFEVESTSYFGAIINVNGTSITDIKRMYELTHSPLYKGGGYTVFCDGDEVFFDTFEKAYGFAMNEQKNTFRKEN